MALALRFAVFGFAGMVALHPAALVAQMLAFPGAEGAGRFATGGRGGDVYYVTNLNDSGPGSLRQGISSANGPRTILFSVSGTIHLNSNLDINKPNLTIAGQSAPGGGVTLASRMTRVNNTSNIILQHLRFRVGDTHTRGTDNTYEPDSLWVSGSNNVMVDHVSASWSIDECLSVTHGSTHITVQWSTIAESLKNGGHHKGAHGYGSLINGGEITYHHNLYANHDSRNPRPGQSSVDGQTTRLDFVNNVTANPGGRYGYSGSDPEQVRLNFVGNFGLDGPNTTAPSLFVSGGAGTQVYSSGNARDSNKNGLVDGVATGGLSGTYTPVSVRFDLPEVTTTSAERAYISVLSRAGANFARDPVDRRVIRDVINQSGAIIDSQTQVGGWPALATGTARLDSNGDGVPDYYAVARNFSPTTPIGHLTGPTGYTYLEEYLHSLTPASYEPKYLSSGMRIQVTRDAQVGENGSPATSVGSGGSTTLGARWNNLNRNEYILLRFDLGMIHPCSVTEARIELTAAANHGSSTRLRVYGVEQDTAGWDWTEEGVTFATTPGLVFDGSSLTRGSDMARLLILGTLDASGSVVGQTVGMTSANLAVYLNLTAYFNDLPQAGVVTLLLERIDQSGTAATFYSREQGGDVAPRLVLTATPRVLVVPEAGLVGWGVVGLVGLWIGAGRSFRKGGVGKLRA